MDTLRISQLAARTGVPATTLRYYESAGLLPAARTPAGYRVYGRDAVDRLAFIGAAKHLGLSLEEIAELLAVWAAADCRTVRADLRPRVLARLAAAEERAAELASFTATLRAALARLDALPDRSGRCDPSCVFLEPPGAPEAAAPEPEPPLAEQPPVACSLDGGGFAERTAAWRRLTEGARCAPLSGGVRLTVPADRAAAFAELVVSEQRCCPFLAFRLVFDGPELHCEVTGPAEAAELLDGLFGPPDAHEGPPPRPAAAR
ncbi:MerR family transcriptional regulator [Streptomyces sp. 3MP-14]|uniref:MerR family transcriptional regulator n=1 Tax=Streptomyces mimosae TaxID=2586635 RepID=A0A5N6A472_9ACTN|nr:MULTISPECIES: MerR family transcriptional regulator [Streptomyces]KAB8162198.1 MerR family transcriptional regulator [Streptomyces mimosae]KAB8173903.1 MerR family transcriptional regulator [Streptomyces sp. 3MP-14]